MTGLPILLIGAGGHATSCIDVVERNAKYSIAGLIASPTELHNNLLGYEVIGTSAELGALVADIPHALVAIGQINTPEPRIRMFEQLQQSGFDMPAIVSPSAYVSSHAQIGSGTIVMHGAVVNANAVVGKNCIINSQSLVEHDAEIADHCHVSTAVAINGNVRIGAGTFIGSRSVVREGISVGEGCFVGMGQRVVADCKAGSRITKATQ